MIMQKEHSNKHLQCAYWVGIASLDELLSNPPPNLQSNIFDTVRILHSISSNTFKSGDIQKQFGSNITQFDHLG